MCSLFSILFWNYLQKEVAVCFADGKGSAGMLCHPSPYTADQCTITCCKKTIHLDFQCKLHIIQTHSFNISSSSSSSVFVWTGGRFTIGSKCGSGFSIRSSFWSRSPSSFSCNKVNHSSQRCYTNCLFLGNVIPHSRPQTTLYKSN